MLNLQLSYVNRSGSTGGGDNPHVLILAYIAADGCTTTATTVQQIATASVATRHLLEVFNRLNIFGYRPGASLAGGRTDLLALLVAELPG